MAEGRIIKASAFTSDSISRLSDFQFRLWVGLITHADNVGRGDARPAILKGQIFPLRDRVRDSDIKKALEALADNGSIFLYEVSGKPFYAFPKWYEHQRLRADSSKFPSPDDPAATRRNSPQVAATRRNSPQVAATCGDLPQLAATRRNSPQVAAERGLARTRVEEEEEEKGRGRGRGREVEEKCVLNAHTREEEREDRFEEFWTAYPKKSGDIREACFEYLGAVQSGVSEETIIQAVKDQVAVKDTRYFPSADKWLRNKGWTEKAEAKEKDKRPAALTGDYGAVDMDKLSSFLESMG